jgi:hypothetical protein
MRGEQVRFIVAVGLLLCGCSRKEDATAAVPAAPPIVSAPAKTDAPAGPVRFVDGDARPIREARLALLSREDFDDKDASAGAVAASPERVRILVEDPAADAPASVTVSTLTLPLEGPPGRRLTRPFLLIGDRRTRRRGRIRRRRRPEGASRHAIGAHPRRASGRSCRGPRDSGPIRRRRLRASADGRNRRKRFRSSGPGERRVGAAGPPLHARPGRPADQLPGLFSIRGRAAGVDGQGRPSRCGLRIDGAEVAVPGVWRNDGAPMTPKATAAAIQAKAGRFFSFSILDGLLAGDREGVVVRVRRGDGTAATVEALAEGHDVAQAVAPLPAQLQDGIEVSPMAGVVTLEVALRVGEGRSLGESTSTS